jgi:hypothetical protein
MEAEIFTEDPEPLIGLGYELEVIDWLDDDGTTIVATTLTELEEIAFFHHVAAIVGPLEGTVLEAGLNLEAGVDSKARSGKTLPRAPVLRLRSSSSLRLPRLLHRSPPLPRR